MSHEHIPSKLAIASIIGGVALYDALCPRGETISEGADRLRETKIGKYLVPLVVATTSMHLTRTIPEKYDWLQWVGKLAGKIGKEDIK